jgi:hypothetical protein
MVKYIVLFITIVFGVLQFISYQNLKKGLNTIKTNSENAKKENASGAQGENTEENKSKE